MNDLRNLERSLKAPFRFLFFFFGGGGGGGVRVKVSIKDTQRLEHSNISSDAGFRE